MSYQVSEIFYSLQGEGAQAGRPAIFIRFSGCNLQCSFCDTEHGRQGEYGGEYESAAGLITRAASLRSTTGVKLLIVLTGGEPALQIDTPLIEGLQEQGFEVAVETNGTVPLPPGIDWVCVSPKSGRVLRVTGGNELKLLFPQAGLAPEDVEELEFDHFFLQPVDGPEREKNTREAIGYCLGHPRWRLSLQLHKFLNIP